MEVLMMRISALAIRILRQIIRDKRTLGMLLFAPILVLTMLHLVFNEEAYTPNIGFVNMPEEVLENINTEGASISDFTTDSSAAAALSDRTLDAYIVMEKSMPAIYLEGSRSEERR